MKEIWEAIERLEKQSETATLLFKSVLKMTDNLDKRLAKIEAVE